MSTRRFGINDSNPIQAFPEQLDRRKSKRAYTVSVSDNASVSKPRRILNLDVGKSMFSKQKHEYGHLIWSPSKAPSNPDPLWVRIRNAVEDGRVNLACSRSGIPVDNILSEYSKFLDVADKVVEEQPIEIVLMAIARLGTDIQRLHEQYAYENTPELMFVYEEVKSFFNDPVNFSGPYTCPYESTEIMTNKIYSLFTDTPDDGESNSVSNDNNSNETSNENSNSPNVPGESDVIPDSNDPVEDNSPEGSFKFGLDEQTKKKFKPSSLIANETFAKKSYIDRLQTNNDNRIDNLKEKSSLEIENIISSRNSVHNTNWAPLYNHLKTLDMRTVSSAIKSSNGRAISRCSIEGSVIKRPDRLYSDGHIFRAPVKNREGWAGGTILLDLSGSMGLTFDQVISLVNKAPYKTFVAGYAGDTMSRNRPKITINPMFKNYFSNVHKKSSFLTKTYCALIGLAYHGKIAREEEIKLINSWGDHSTGITLCYNSSDGLALRWLASMPKPLVWISDGFVNGASGVSDYALEIHVQKILEENKITWLTNISEFKAYTDGHKELAIKDYSAVGGVLSQKDLDIRDKLEQQGVNISETGE